ncbi:hypothetical protein SAMN05421858_5133 [Haladaptatus litoreus]|uniref:Ribbon-helix-helix protein, copG family n=1 Tax=Haladaptatus litoreus TaxID=553468 RepID=A0A1N7FK61_9EURY|nr:hypothetical protein [Haladaptatus litoreus]SIS00752.1 hypothetical protein SAMN05421858_5133 [Haladaptatus litoreus]
MEQITARVETELAEEIERRASEHDVSKSEATRTLLERGTEYAELENENKRLRNQLQALTARQNEHEELVEYVEREKSLQTRREERNAAPAWERFRMWLLGYDTSGD